MRKTEYRRYKADKVEILAYGDELVIKDREKNKFYHAKQESLKKDIPWQYFNSKVTWLEASLLVFLTVLMAVEAIVLSSKQAGSVTPNLTIGILVPVFVTFTIAQIVVHEFAHAAVLHYFGRSPDRIGFHLSLWVFPSVYVRMNDVTMLPYQDRIVVDDAGLVVNALISLLASVCNMFIRSIPAATVLEVYNLALVFNMLPILHTDGYRILLAFFRMNEYRSAGSNGRIIVAIKVLSYLIAILYALLFMLFLVRIVTGKPIYAYGLWFGCRAIA